MRVFIEDYSGRLSGSVYQDRILPRSDNGIVVKTHELDRDHFTAAIHIVRHPLDAIESYFHWRRDIARHDVAWDEHVPWAARGWAAHGAHWSHTGYDTLRVRYEDMLRGPSAAFGRVVEFLQLPVDADQLEETLRGTTIDELRNRFPSIGERFFRRGLALGGSGQPFTDTQIAGVQEVCGKYMRDWGYPDDCAAATRDASR